MSLKFTVTPLTTIMVFWNFHAATSRGGTVQEQEQPQTRLRSRITMIEELEIH